MSEAQGTPVDEMAMAAWWRDHRSPLAMTDVDGNHYEIVHRGAWTHGNGPDFAGAMVAVNDRNLLTGSIELHLRCASWYAHGHHLDPAYNDVILHVTNDGHLEPVRCHNGKLVPTVQLAASADELEAYRNTAWQSWSVVGGEVCASGVSASTATQIVEALSRLGDTRLANKSAQFEAQLIAGSPGEVLYAAVMEVLGYQANRSPMRQHANLLPLYQLESLVSSAPKNRRFETAASLLAGVGGFLPLAPVEQAMTGLSPDSLANIENQWAERAGHWQHDRMAATAWASNRSRPANHPLLRLLSASAIVANAEDGLFASLLDLVRAPDDPVDRIVELASLNSAPFGRARAVTILANAVLPFALAYGELGEEADLGEHVARQWEKLPASEDNAITKRAENQVSGRAIRLPRRERSIQGLIHLDQSLCTPRRCFECPVAKLVVADQLSLSTIR